MGTLVGVLLFSGTANSQLKINFCIDTCLSERLPGSLAMYCSLPIKSNLKNNISFIESKKFLLMSENIHLKTENKSLNWRSHGKFKSLDSSLSYGCLLTDAKLRI